MLKEILPRISSFLVMMFLFKIVILCLQFCKSIYQSLIKTSSNFAARQNATLARSMSSGRRDDVGLLPNGKFNINLYYVSPTGSFKYITKYVYYYYYYYYTCDFQFSQIHVHVKTLVLHLQENVANILLHHTYNINSGDEIR